jgi:hypothetical protein
MIPGSRSIPVLVLVLLLVAALTRLVGLGREPLDAEESSQSIAAWWTVTGVDEDPPRLDPRPASALLLSLDTFVFWLSGGAGDAMARLAPAAIGTALVLLPIGLGSVGRSGAVGLALLLAVDPWLVASSRRASGAILAAGAAIACHLFLRHLGTVTPGPATARAARRQWLGWSVALGLLLVSGTAAWDFLPPVLAAAALQTGRRADGTPPVDRPRPGLLLGLVGTVALLGATTGLVQWRGPALVSVALESWVASFTGAVGSVDGSVPGGGGPRGMVAIAYLVVLAALAAWGLVPAWRRRPALDRPFDSPYFRRVEAEGLGLWLAWGAILQLRPGREAAGWLAFEVPLLLAASLGLEEVTWRVSRRRASTAGRFALAAAAAAAIAVGLLGVHRMGRDDGGSVLAPARRLAADVAALEERPAAERPIVEVSTGDRIDAVLAWYLRDSNVRWVGAGGGTLSSEPRILLTPRTVRSTELLDLPPTRRYVIAASGDQVEVVEMQ